jgi:hypothetical protein
MLQDDLAPDGQPRRSYGVSNGIIFEAVQLLQRDLPTPEYQEMLRRGRRLRV